MWPSVAAVREPHLRLGAPLVVAAMAGCACAAIWIGEPTQPGSVLPACPTKALLGIDCPGCGSLRMIYSLMHGDFLAALRFNAIGLLAVGLLAWAFGVWTYGRLSGRRVRSWQNYRWSAMIALVVVTVWFVIRNLPFEPFASLYV
ncbi:DUF2752 domain-containing protein [Mycolicibacterium brisbanense]|uniref:Transmembrane protein n=1 Tax=Mycolicibacterium brisbanense TaxID=146020 RepID=A0A100W0U2_9MYCO|nr:DUF2752 domain-containing protein [Mycolicibacterium brisbanense]MCV7156810.1 DUF2752 domain-containing protein [Mycolicibacterium brisbanense]GAS89527.1 protein of unknown function [Mycolicibacterium brisbanense]